MRVWACGAAGWWAAAAFMGRKLVKDTKLVKPGYVVFLHWAKTGSVSEPAPKPDALQMLDDETLWGLDGEAVAMIEAAGGDPERGMSMDALCRHELGVRPRYVRMVGTGDVSWWRGEPIVRVHEALPPWRQREVLSHEISEGRATKIGRAFTSLAEREAWCDALGARLLCPAPAFRRVVSRVGHRVHGIAEAFGVSQALSLLRLGEVTGRPVVLLRQPAPLARGRDFAWPPAITPRTRTPHAHPIRVENRWGFIATTEAWLSMAA